MDLGEQPGRGELGTELFDPFRKLVLDSDREIAKSKVEQFLVGETGPLGRKRCARHRRRSY
jgi:hypothetical protein